MHVWIEIKQIGEEFQCNVKNAAGVVLLRGERVSDFNKVWTVARLIRATLRMKAQFKKERYPGENEWYFELRSHYGVLLGTSPTYPNNASRNAALARLAEAQVQGIIGEQLNQN